MLAKTERDLDRLVEALIDGVPAGRVKEKMAQLEERKATLESRLAASNDEDHVRIHPNMAGYYREKIASLRMALTGDEPSRVAVEIVRPAHR